MNFASLNTPPATIQPELVNLRSRTMKLPSLRLRLLRPRKSASYANLRLLDLSYFHYARPTLTASPTLRARSHSPRTAPPLTKRPSPVGDDLSLIYRSSRYKLTTIYLIPCSCTYCSHCFVYSCWIFSRPAALALSMNSFKPFSTSLTRPAVSGYRYCFSTCSSAARSAW